MDSEGSVTQWFDELERGNPDATQALWDRFFPELVRLARQKLRSSPRRMADEDDIALSVMDRRFPTKAFSPRSASWSACGRNCRSHRPRRVGPSPVHHDRPAQNRQPSRYSLVNKALA